MNSSGFVPAASHEVLPVNNSRGRIWRAGTLTYTTGGLFILFFWLLWGDFAWSLKDRSIPSTLQLLLRDFHGSDTFAGILLTSLPAALTMLISPIVSYKSDRHRGRWGRRIPFLLIPTPIAVFGIVSLAFSPQMGESLHRALGVNSWGLGDCVLAFLAFSWTLFEVATLVANSVYGGLINDVVPQRVMGRFYGAFRALSLIAAMIFNYWLLGKAEVHYFWIFMGMAAVYGIGFTSMCLKVSEGDYPALVPMDAGRPTLGFFNATKTYFQECFCNSYYWLYFITLGISWQATVPVSLFSVFYAQSLHMGMDVFGKYLALTYLISLVLSYPLGVLADRFHPLRVSIVLLVIYAFVTMMGGLFVNNATTFGVAWVAHGVLAGSWFTAVSSLGQRLLPKAEFAQFFSAASIVQSFCAIVVGIAAGVFLDHMNHHYRYTFFISFGLAVVSVILNLALHSRFMELGGPSHYLAPERGVSLAAESCPNDN